MFNSKIPYNYIILINYFGQHFYNTFYRRLDDFLIIDSQNKFEYSNDLSYLRAFRSGHLFAITISSPTRTRQHKRAAWSY